MAPGSAKRFLLGFFLSSYLKFFYYFKMSPDELCLLTLISLYGKPSLMLKSNSKKIHKQLSLLLSHTWED